MRRVNNSYLTSALVMFVAFKKYSGDTIHDTS